MMRKEDWIFLLGGADLEMQTIREVLLREGIPFADKKLRWDNAFLSSYQKELQEIEEGQTVYGIELREDIVPPACYRAIDHHNESSMKPCALEQVMELLQLPMNRYEQLVAANDKAYIPGMLALNASSEEIASIRRADRKAQGVTDEEEELAEISIFQNLERCGDLLVVKSLVSKFSPICDELYPYKSLLVYTDSEWVFYGERKEKLVDLLSDEVSKKKVFFGGGAKGYVGAVKYAYSEEDIDRFVNYMKQYYK